jgi:hypothetical protein
VVFVIHEPSALLLLATRLLLREAVREVRFAR